MGYVFLIARVGKGRRSKDAINELEFDVINLAFKRNKELRNDRRIRKPKYVVLGFNCGRPPKPVANLKKSLGL